MVLSPDAIALIEGLVQELAALDGGLLLLELSVPKRRRNSLRAENAALKQEIADPTRLNAARQRGVGVAGPH